MVSFSTKGTNRWDCREHPNKANNMTAARIFNGTPLGGGAASTPLVDFENAMQGNGTLGESRSSSGVIEPVRFLLRPPGIEQLHAEIVYIVGIPGDECQFVHK